MEIMQGMGYYEVDFGYYNPNSDTVFVGMYNIIGSELTSLFNDYVVNGSPGTDLVFLISGDKVWIEVTVMSGKYNDALDLLTNTYGMTDLLPNGTNTLLVSGLLPIGNLTLLNNHTDIFNFAEPVFPSVLNSGIVTTLGGAAQGGSYSRAAFDLSGSGVKVGVISDSYNKLPGDPANTIDVPNGDLPGVANPEGHTTAVDVLQDLTFGTGTDEGRAMLQIVHDIAPDADLAFRSGVISPG